MFYILANTQKKETRKSNTHASSKRTKKTIVINSDDENDKENKVAYDLEYQEKALALKERELSLREREAKVHALELSNLEKEQKLKSAN